MARPAACLLPACPQQDRGQRYGVTQHAYSPTISLHRVSNSSQRPGLLYTHKVSQGQPLQCLVYPSTSRLYMYLVYMTTGSIYSVPRYWPIKLQQNCSYFYNPKMTRNHYVTNNYISTQGLTSACVDVSRCELLTGAWLMNSGGTGFRF